MAGSAPQVSRSCSGAVPVGSGMVVSVRPDGGVAASVASPRDWSWRETTPFRLRRPLLAATGDDLVTRIKGPGEPPAARALPPGGRGLAKRLTQPVHPEERPPQSVGVDGIALRRANAAVRHDHEDSSVP